MPRTTKNTTQSNRNTAKPAKLLKANKVTVNLKVKKTNKLTNKNAVYKDKHTRSQALQLIADNTKLTKKQVEDVFDQLSKLIEGHVKRRGSGEFIVPKVGIKIKRVQKKATKKRTMVSPLTGQEVTINAKPARPAVKLTALKGLQELVD